ncbi:DUF4870 family protein [Caulobacter henricii]|uniref:DUF4870 domain-containing protein n=1 Tax=Caulobacter henricii TaxID=69395 RepID=A0A0P0NW41_9CAUL|nr:hypothetical protein [Caulobacter henricii]ALL12215.1 hypothetical protein AQ619_01900 [Caulobacter henricii]
MTDVSAPAPSPVIRAEEDKVLPAVVYGLYLLGFASCAATTVVGLIVAYANRSAAGPINESHYTFAIRSFWLTIGWFLIGLAMFILGLPLSLLLVGIPVVAAGVMIMGLVGVWFAIRCGAGIYYLAKGEAYPRPRTWLI